MRRVLGILAVVLALLLLVFAAMFFGLINPPGLLKDVPYINKLVTWDDKGEKVFAPGLTENDQLRNELDHAQTTIARLENENAELQQRLSVIEKEHNNIKALNEELSAKTGQMQQLAEYYSSMKAKQAAAIMAELDDETVIGILSNMGSETAAAIISQLDPVQAAVLTNKMLQVKGGE